MQKSESIKDLAEALAKFQGEIGAIEKDGYNPHFKNKFTTLDNLIASVKPTLTKNGLSFAQFPDDNGLTTILMHKSGEWIASTAAILVEKQTAQGQGSAYTYSRRYALSGILGITSEEDDDGNEASTPQKPAETPKTAAAPKLDPKPAADEVATLSKKKRIISQLRELGKDTKTALACNSAVRDLTGLELLPENYDAIIKKLGELVVKASKPWNKPKEELSEEDRKALEAFDNEVLPAEEAA